MKKIAIVLGLLLCLAPAASAQATPCLIVDGVEVEKGCLARASTVAHTQGPICIVNGVRVNNAGSSDFSAALKGSQMDIDKDAIERIEVLKGAAAITRYGLEAVNGVIAITLKKGAAMAKNLGNVCGGGPARAVADPFIKYLYPPDFVMAHQDAIGLTERQRTAIAELVRDVQVKSTDSQFKLASVAEKLARTLSGGTVDEASVLLQVDQVLASEREVKRAQITLLVRIKNQLTPEQQAALDKLR